MMFISLKNRTKGFTLIELLVVIAIIGILSSVVLASLSTARAKSRDAKKVSDMGTMQLALELMFDARQSYTRTNEVAGTASYDGGIQQLVASNYLPQLPIPPVGSGGAGGNVTKYQYRGLLSNGGAECILATDVCLSYFLGATLERTDNSVFISDADQDLSALATAYAFTAGLNTGGGKMTGLGLNGAANRGCGYVAPGDVGANASTELCYDLKP